MPSRYPSSRPGRDKSALGVVVAVCVLASCAGVEPDEPRRLSAATASRRPVRAPVTSPAASFRLRIEWSPRPRRTVRPHPSPVRTAPVAGPDALTLEAVARELTYGPGDAVDVRVSACNETGDAVRAPERDPLYAEAVRAAAVVWTSPRGGGDSWWLPGACETFGASWSWKPATSAGLAAVRSRVAGASKASPTDVVCLVDVAPFPSRVDVRAGTGSLQAEVASSSSQRQQGYMHRACVHPGAGMLFVFRGPQSGGFWMKNTLVPLSIAYMRRTDGGYTVVSMADMEPCTADPCRTYPAGTSYDAALEVNKGWFTAHGVGVGTAVSVEGDVPAAS